MVFCCFHPIRIGIFRLFVLQNNNNNHNDPVPRPGPKQSFKINKPIVSLLCSCSFLILCTLCFIFCSSCSEWERIPIIYVTFTNSHTCRSLGKQLIVCKRDTYGPLALKNSPIGFWIYKRLWAYSLRARNQLMYNSHSMSDSELREGGEGC